MKPDEGAKTYSYKYPIETISEKMVADYAHVTIFDAEEMDCLTFWGLEKDAYIYQAQQTEKGKDYLESCWVNSQVQPDRKALRELFGIKRKEGEQREEV